MNPFHARRRRAAEQGVALLIAIFALMLISAVAISLVLMSGTGSAIDSNYRNSTKAFYEAYAGLEEGRGRMAPLHPDTILNTLPSPLSVSPTIQVQYILNPAPGETVAPTNLAASNKYADFEFAQEWGVPVTNATVQVLLNIASDSNLAGLNGPLYKWVRITGLTEAAAKIDIDGDGNEDPAFPIFYAGGNEYVDNLGNSLIQGNQVYRLTALAVLPDGSRRMLQYDVTMNTLNLAFPSALTFDGHPASYGSASSMPFYMNGNDGAGHSGEPAGCTPSQPVRPAMGDINNGDTSTLDSSLFRPNHYLGNSGPPSVSNISSSLPTSPVNYSTPSGLDGPQPSSLTQTLLANATAVATCGNWPAAPFCNFTDANIPLGSATSPVIDFVEGNLSLGPVTGYGILVVTGNLTMSGNSGWRGAVLVIGQGTMAVSGGGNNEIDGALFLANTRDTSGNLLNTLGPTSLNWSGGGGNGVYFDSCWLSNAQNSIKKFNVLSFREILNF